MGAYENRPQMMVEERESCTFSVTLNASQLKLASSEYKIESSLYK